MVTDCHKKHDYSKFRPVEYPVKHKAKVPFDPRLTLDLEYRSIIREIRHLDEELGSFILGSADYLDLVNDAYADNIHWSTKIEGNRLSLGEVKLLTARYTSGESLETSNGPVQEILNHLHSFFSDDTLSLPWDRGTVLSVHGRLMEGVNPDVIPGEIRTQDISVIGTDDFEYFRACPPAYIEMELDSLLDWLNGSPFDELVTAAVFFHEFESIHPFKDGNGRTGRTLFQILLQKMGLRNCNLCKFEQEMLRDPGTYYDLLAFTDATGSYGQLVMFIAESLLEAYRNAAAEFRSKDRLKDMDDNTRKLVMMSKQVASFTLTEATSWVPGVGSQTIRSRLDELVDMDILEKRGATKGLRYSFKDPLKNLRWSQEQHIDR